MSGPALRLTVSTVVRMPPAPPLPPLRSSGSSLCRRAELGFIAPAVIGPTFIAPALIVPLLALPSALIITLVALALAADEEAENVSGDMLAAAICCASSAAAAATSSAPTIPSWRIPSWRNIGDHRRGGPIVEDPGDKGHRIETDPGDRGRRCGWGCGHIVVVCGACGLADGGSIGGGPEGLVEVRRERVDDVAALVEAGSDPAPSC